MLRISVLQFNVTFHVDNMLKVGVYWLYVTLHHNNGGPCVPTQPVTINTTCDHKRVSKLVTVDKELTHFNKYINLQLFLQPPPWLFFFLVHLPAVFWCLFSRISCQPGWPLYFCKMADVFVQDG